MMTTPHLIPRPTFEVPPANQPVYLPDVAGVRRTLIGRWYIYLTPTPVRLLPCPPEHGPCEAVRLRNHDARPILFGPTAPGREPIPADCRTPLDNAPADRCRPADDPTRTAAYAPTGGTLVVEMYR